MSLHQQIFSRQRRRWLRPQQLSPLKHELVSRNVSPQPPPQQYNPPLGSVPLSSVSVSVSSSLRLRIQQSSKARIFFSTTTTTTQQAKPDSSSNSDSGATSNDATKHHRSSATTAAITTSVAIPKPLLFRYLDLQAFSVSEVEGMFDRIQQFPLLQSDDENNNNDTKTESLAGNNDTEPWSTEPTIHFQQLQAYFDERLSELEQEGTNQNRQMMVDDNNHDNNAKFVMLRRNFCESESQRIWKSLLQHAPSSTSSSSTNSNLYLTKQQFCQSIRTKATAVDVQHTWPIAASMVLVGSSVGVITPAMPFVVEQLSLTASEYGLIVSAFALAKMAANIPSAIAIERHGRKPYMVHSLGLIALGVGGIGMASSFYELFACRFVAGVGVSLLSTSATLMMTDLSTPLNRASTMAPIMSGFSAGTALGPALGGIMVDSLGLNPTFYVVGVSFLGVAALNRVILHETQRRPLSFPWMTEMKKDTLSSTTKQQTEESPSETLATATQSTDGDDDKNTATLTERDNIQNHKDTLAGATQNAVGQWIPLFRKPNVQSILFMNGFYWFALAGGQMTLMPLIMTTELHMTASEVGHAYMGMSVVQIVGNPVFAHVIDRMGKAPAIAAGCTLICLPMAALPLVEPGNPWQLAAVLGVWAAGSSMLSTAPLAYVSDQVQEGERAQAIALLRTCGDVGFLVGASAIGALAQFTDTTYAIQASAGLLFTATTWFGIRQALGAQISKATVASAAASQTAKTTTTATAATKSAAAGAPPVVTTQPSASTNYTANTTSTMTRTITPYPTTTANVPLAAATVAKPAIRE
ncbi:hypothetical protein ACA910_002107 [Epithemia clementina (nom. ined.)]